MSSLNSNTAQTSTLSKYNPALDLVFYTYLEHDIWLAVYNINGVMFLDIRRKPDPGIGPTLRVTTRDGIFMPNAAYRKLHEQLMFIVRENDKEAFELKVQEWRTDIKLIGTPDRKGENWVIIYTNGNEKSEMNLTRREMELIVRFDMSDMMFNLLKKNFCI